MKIPELGNIQMMRTSEQHFGQNRVVPSDYRLSVESKVNSVDRITESTEGTGLGKDGSSMAKSFEDYLLEAVNSVNSDQLNLNSIQQKLITDPDDVDIHDVTIAMSKARMSLNLAQTVIDRLVQGWSEITTTR